MTDVQNDHLKSLLILIQELEAQAVENAEMNGDYNKLLIESSEKVIDLIECTEKELGEKMSELVRQLIDSITNWDKEKAFKIALDYKIHLQTQIFIRNGETRDTVKPLLNDIYNLNSVNESDDIDWVDDYSQRDNHKSIRCVDCNQVIRTVPISSFDPTDVQMCEQCESDY